MQQKRMEDIVSCDGRVLGVVLPCSKGKVDFSCIFWYSGYYLTHRVNHIFSRQELFRKNGFPTKKSDCISSIDNIDDIWLSDTQCQDKYLGVN